MKDIPSELLYVLMFLAVMVVQYLMKRFGPQALPEPTWDERLEQIPSEVAQAPAEVPVVNTGHGVPRDASRAAPAHRRFSRGALMGNRRAVQNAMVITAVLGPCRTFEPHDIRQ